MQPVQNPQYQQQQMLQSQNQQMEAAYNQQMGYQVPIQSAPVTPVVHTNHMTVPVASGWAIKSADFGLFFTKILALLLTMCTLGLAYPWGANMIISKWANNVRIEGRAIRYTGTGGGLFGVWIKVFLLSVITLGIYYLFWGKKAVAKYVDANIMWA